MKTWHNNNRIPIKCWTDDIEDECLKQANNLANLPFAFHHIALMPDCHSGYGMPIGGVLAAHNVVVPNAVGVDIGCGMVAVKTSAKEITTEQIKKILGKAREVIPVGFNHHKEPQASDVFKEAPSHIPIIRQELQSAKYQLGTLGGGNHVIEIQKGDDGFIWLMLHSGSRNLGKKVADYFNKKAVELNKKWRAEVPKEWDLAFLPANTEEGQNYIEAMNFCLAFAYANRSKMMDRFIEIFYDITGHTPVEQIDVHHNYAALEKHYGEKVWVHRKGAIRMRKGEIGIIPGSMGTPSYIVEGLGNPESFHSASHGAGRKMSRRKANEVITEEMAQEAMKGIVFGRFNGKYDECPQAYKDIDEVIANELDLIKPLVKLVPLGVMKG
ncbi:protein of unknown function UPF0027 [Thermosinus carboxydivorans Nor1]|uniref:3'-phosphate/5'-hydroxy nucleic acid ligase n=1 Tax=Thermosinus carboxydivorans Nor1 TaxID=401526 RepID=A1HQY1_9FIRM|nr:RtcB family protein [Thermosinus carboxydivorans]EAX47490.1 protein of unknown function UPF0027 [Thermosinus carboxydivorans Nor1]